MTDADREREDEVLKRMLKTPHKPHKDKSSPPVAKRVRGIKQGKESSER